MYEGIPLYEDLGLYLKDDKLGVNLQLINTAQNYNLIENFRLSRNLDKTIANNNTIVDIMIANDLSYNDVVGSINWFRNNKLRLPKMLCRRKRTRKERPRIAVDELFPVEPCRSTMTARQKLYHLWYQHTDFRAKLACCLGQYGDVTSGLVKLWLRINGGKIRRTMTPKR